MICIVIAGFGWTASGQTPDATEVAETSSSTSMVLSTGQASSTPLPSDEILLPDANQGEAQDTGETLSIGIPTPQVINVETRKHPSSLTSWFSGLSPLTILILCGLGGALWIIFVFAVARIAPRVEPTPQLPLASTLSEESLASLEDTSASENSIPEETTDKEPVLSLPSMILESKSNTMVSVGPFKAMALEPWVFAQKHEDRIYTGLLARKYPAIVLADGVTETVLNGKAMRGGGGPAADLVCREVVQALNMDLRRVKSLEAAILTLNMVFDNANRKLKASNEKRIQDSLPPGSTMLLVAFLFGSTSPSWVYGFIGTGRIVIINPKHVERNFPVETVLLDTSRLTNPTKTLPSVGHNHVVASSLYRPGDILYAASDGFDDVADKLASTQRVSPGTYFWEQVIQRNKIDITSKLLESDEFLQSARSGDDVTLGLIWSG